jgi:hypothetical protein
MSSKLTTANELQGVKKVLGGIVKMTNIKRIPSLWWRSVSKRFPLKISPWFYCLFKYVD